MASRPRFKWGPLHPRDVGWAMVIGLWVGFAALVAVGLSFILVMDTAKVTGPARWVGYVVGACFMAFGVMVLDPLLMGSNRILRVAVDARGIRLGNRLHPDNVVLSWSEIAGIGRATRISPRPGVVKVAQGRSLEVFTEAQVTPHEWVAIAVDEDAPHPGLPRRRLRFSSVSGAQLDGIAQQIMEYRPDLWLGEVEREWDPLPGR